MSARLAFAPLAIAIGVSSLALPGLASANTPTATPSNEEMWKLIQAQQAQIKALTRKLNATQQQLAETDEKVEATGEMVEKTSASASSSQSKNSIGGYGELHYNHTKRDTLASTDEIDFHRFVLFFGHEFNERIRFFSELEVEHAFSGPAGANGAVEIEQAYIEGDINDQLSAKAGLFMVPVGILNETHEPPTFYGVERNSVESIIIPSTWWGGGLGLSGKSANGFSWDLALQEGLAVPTTGGSALRIRSGRQKTSQANGKNFAYTGRIKYTGTPGLELAATLRYEDDITQTGGDGVDSATLLETHAIWNRGPFSLRALYARWDLDANATALAAASGRNAADKQDGWYIEPGYKINESWGVFARYSDVDGARAQDEFRDITAGINWWPHEDVVIKMDVHTRDNDSVANRNEKGLSLGVGYQF